MFNHPRVSKDLIVGGIHASINTLIYIGARAHTHSHSNIHVVLHLLFPIYYNGDFIISDIWIPFFPS
jgi:hypothetical protein